MLTQCVSSRSSTSWRCWRATVATSARRRKNSACIATRSAVPSPNSDWTRRRYGRVYGGRPLQYAPRELPDPACRWFRADVSQPDASKSAQNATLTLISGAAPARQPFVGQAPLPSSEVAGRTLRGSSTHLGCQHPGLRDADRWTDNDTDARTSGQPGRQPGHHACRRHTRTARTKAGPRPCAACPVARTGPGRR